MKGTTKSASSPFGILKITHHMLQEIQKSADALAQVLQRPGKNLCPFLGFCLVCPLRSRCWSIQNCTRDASTVLRPPKSLITTPSQHSQKTSRNLSGSSTTVCESHYTHQKSWVFACENALYHMRYLITRMWTCKFRMRTLISACELSKSRMWIQYFEIACDFQKSHANFWHRMRSFKIACEF